MPASSMYRVTRAPLMMTWRLRCLNSRPTPDLIVTDMLAARFFRFES